ncbi:MAG: hypothetical protein LBC45_04370 [Chlamydiales bacterium]|jgi:hypothetical protein|nr:hypothetical protein [Chlamydiales bacterium]
MTVALNLSEQISSLEYNLYKGVSRSKINIQQKMEACILETDKIVEQKCAEYRREALIMSACAIGMIACAIIGATIDLKLASVEGSLNQLKHKTLSMRENTQIKDLTIEMGEYNAYKNIVNITSQVFDRGSNTYSYFSKISHAQLDHENQKMQMCLQQLQQERANPLDQILLNDAKDMRRRQQQAKAAAG